MRHYLTMYVKIGDGGWRAIFPDFPGCEAAAESLDAATLSAFMTLTQHAHDRRAPLPRPSSLSDVQKRADWIAGQGIDLEKAIVSLTPLNGFVERESSTP